MADFSKQYCELYDMGFEGDFDILEEFNKLQTGHYVSYICEGFGFLAIGKEADGNCMLAMPVKDAPTETYGTMIEWVKYEEVVK